MRLTKRIAVLFAAIAVFAAAYCMPAAAITESENTYLEAYGAAFGMAAYNTQIVAGMSADSFVGGVYDAKEIKDIIAEQKSMITVLLDYINKVGNASSEEGDVLADMKNTCLLLNDTLDALETYIDNQTQDNADAYEKARKASYAAIADLMGLEK